MVSLGVAAAGAFRAERERDPLRTFRCSSWAQRRLLEECGRVEVFWRSGNKGGKTLGGAALGVALARGLPSLDGVSLPRLRSPNVGWLIVPSYKQSLDSAVAAYKQMIGHWPHHEARVSGAQGYVSTLYVRPQSTTCEHWGGWSKIVVFVDQGVAPVGGAIDWAHADEPPSEVMWREVRFRWRANSPFIRYITATPLERRGWEWLKEDFKGSLGRAQGGKLEIQSSLYDNQALLREDIQRAEEDAANDPHRLARLMGEYVDATGSSPWGGELYATLDRWEKRCFDPTREEVIIQGRVERPSGRVVMSVSAEVELWGAPDKQDLFLATADPSSGARSEKNDPAGIQVWSRRRRALVGRFNGYLDPYALGQLGALLSARYGAAQGDVETNGGWAQGFLAGWHDWQEQHPKERVGVILADRDERAYGRWRKALGWVSNKDTRGKCLTALQRALAQDDVGIWSADVVSCLKGSVIDANNKILAGPHGHDEDLILAGRALYLITSRPAPPERAERPGQAIEEVLRQEFGRTVWKAPRAVQPGPPDLRWER